MKPMWFGIVTLFPEMFAALDNSILGRARKNNVIQLNFWSPRDFALDKHKTVDDHPYGGGPGMLMRGEPLAASIKAAKAHAEKETKVVYLSPQGKLFDQTIAERLASERSLILLCGRYEGIDNRVLDTAVDEELSIGDYILTGGELAAMVVIDAISRFIPGCLGDEASCKEDSLMAGLLKYPQYTRPENFAGLPVPEVLLKGHHQQIERWRKKQALGNTWLKRPDLLEKRLLDSEENSLLNEFISEFQQNNPRKTI